MERDLDIIAETAELLDAAEIKVWLWGGWAVDFLVGRVTRRHRDIDFLVDETVSPRVGACLAPHGYHRRIGVLEDERGLWPVFRRRRRDISFAPIRREPSGAIVTPGRFHDQPWVPGAFAASRQMLEGVSAFVVSAEALLQAKTSPDVPPWRRDLDARDAAILLAPRLDQAGA